MRRKKIVKNKDGKYVQKWVDQGWAKATLSQRYEFEQKEKSEINKFF